MPLVADEVVLGQEFNRALLDTVNCELVKPPYLAGRVPYQFFLKKRRALDLTLDFGMDEVYDLYKSGSDFYAYGKVGSTMEVRKNNASTTVLTLGAPITGYTYKFVFPLMPTGAIYDYGVSTATVTEFNKLTDSTKSWGVGTLGGKYVYCYVANVSGVGNGDGQWALIASNTATELVLSTPFSGPGVLGTKYRIYDSIDNAISVTSDTGIYVIHKESGTALTKSGTVFSNVLWTDGIAGTDVTLLRTIGPVLDGIYKDGRWYLALPSLSGRPNAAFVSAFTDSAAAIYQSMDSSLGYIQDCLNVFQFQEYVIFSSRSQLKLVKETILQGSSGESYSSFSLSILSDNFGQFSTGAFSVWNQSLFMLTNQKRFVSVSIVPVYGSQFKIDIQQQGVYIQGFLDNFTDSDKVSITIDENDIWLVRRPSAGDSWVLRYDIAYKGWHRWTTGSRVTKVWNGDNSSPRFLGAGAFTLSGGIGYKDRLGVGGTEYAYDQSIQVIFGDARPRSFKNLNAVVFTIGPSTTRESTVSATSRFGGVIGNASASLLTSQYLLSVLTAIGNPGQGGNLLGPWPYPPGDLQAPVASDVADCAVIEWHIAHHCVFSILEWKGLGDEAVEFGGCTVSYEEGSPLNVDPYNTITE